MPTARNVSLTLRCRHGATLPSAAVLREINDNATAPFAAWQRMGSPQSLTPTQLAALEAASQPKDSWVRLERGASAGEARLRVELPAYGVARVSVAFE